MPSPSMRYAFTNNWFDKHVEIWKEMLAYYKPSKVLEIGSYEGRSATFVIDQIAHARDLVLHCVDTWEGGIEHGNQGFFDLNNTTAKGMHEVERRFKENISKSIAAASHKVDLSIHKGLSSIELSKLISSGLSGYFDMVYVDGSHQAEDVLLDAVLAFQLTAKGGLIIFDDYTWQEPSPGGADPLRCPKIAIDSFTNIYSKSIRLNDRVPLYQIMVNKC